MTNRITRGTGLVGSLAVSGDVAAGSFTFGNQQAAIAKPGATAADDKDTEAREAIDDIIDALTAVGILAAE